jgi:hypothetical protein
MCNSKRTGIQWSNKHGDLVPFSLRLFESVSAAGAKQVLTWLVPRHTLLTGVATGDYDSYWISAWQADLSWYQVRNSCTMLSSGVTSVRDETEFVQRAANVGRIWLREAETTVADIFRFEATLLCRVQTEPETHIWESCDKHMSNKNWRKCFQAYSIIRLFLMMMFLWAFAPRRLVGRCRRFGETYCLHLQFRPEDGDNMILRNFGIYRRVYTAPKPRRTSSSPPWKPQISQDCFVF